MDKNNVWFITPKTNLHVGNENNSSYGLIDLAVQRNVTTGLPCINSSSLKGALNEYAAKEAKLSSDDLIRIFGSDKVKENGKSRNKTIIYPEGQIECRDFFSKRNPHAHPAVLFRKSFFDKLNGKKYRPEYRQNQDTMLWYDGMMAGTQHANIPDVVLNFRMTNAMFKKRRNGWAFAKKQFTDRLMINRGLDYGWKADVYGFAMFCMLVSPAWVKKIAYRIFR